MCPCGRHFRFLRLCKLHKLPQLHKVHLPHVLWCLLYEVQEFGVSGFSPTFTGSPLADARLQLELCNSQLRQMTLVVISLSMSKSLAL